MTRARPAPNTLGACPWAAYAGCAWALSFAALSFYWAAGGTAGSSTLGPSIAEPALARDAGFVALLWGTGVLKVLAGVLALALARRFGSSLPRPLFVVGGWAATGVMAGYEGGASLVQHGLMELGVIATPDGLGQTALRWHLALWDPWWLLGGLLFALATRWYQRTTDDASFRERQARRVPVALAAQSR